MQIVIDTAQTRLTIKEQCFYIQSKTIKRKISPKRISSMAITSNALVSASAIILAAENKIPIYYFNRIGEVKAKLWSPYFSNLASVRHKQLRLMDSIFATNFIIDNLKLKFQNQIRLLRRLENGRSLENKKNSVKEFEEQAEKQLQNLTQYQAFTISQCRHQIMGMEGSISRRYWLCVSQYLPEEYYFSKRTRRPAKDVFNSALNYAYGMTYSVVENGIFTAGLDPFIGFLHVESYRRTSLVFDLIEPFRPLVDKLVIQLFSDQKLLTTHFQKIKNGYQLNSSGKKVIIPSYNEYIEKRIEFNGQRRSLKNHIFRYCNQLTMAIKKEDL